MPAWLMSALRTAVQAAWGSLAAWTLGFGVALPAVVPDWVQELTVVVLTLLVTMLIRWLESLDWGPARKVARSLMLGMRPPA